MILNGSEIFIFYISSISNHKTFKLRIDLVSLPLQKQNGFVPESKGCKSNALYLRIVNLFFYILAKTLIYIMPKN